MKIKKLPIIKEYEKLSLEELTVEKERLRTILHEELDLMMDGMADVKGYKNQEHLTVRKSMQNNWNLYQNCRMAWGRKHTRERIWNDDCSGGEILTQDEFDKMVEEGKAVRYKNSASVKKEK